jgi:hypothetical protein
MLKLYIDESGDLGLNEGYFIIAMLMAHDSNRIKNIIKNFCAYHGLEEVHANKLNFPNKQFLINKLTKQIDYSVSYIVVDKMMIENKKLFKSNNLLFNYLVSFLVKDVFKANTDNIMIYMDNRNQKVASINSLSEYIQIKAMTSWGFDKDTTFQYCNSKNHKSIQMVDFIANCIRRKYVHKNKDFYNRLNIAKSIQFPRGKFREKICSS